MNIKIFLCILCVTSVSSECKSLLDCLKGVIKYFVSSNVTSDPLNYNVNIDNNTNPKNNENVKDNAIFRLQNFTSPNKVTVMFNKTKVFVTSFEIDDNILQFILDKEEGNITTTGKNKTNTYENKFNLDSSQYNNDVKYVINTTKKSEIDLEETGVKPLSKEYITEKTNVLSIDYSKIKSKDNNANLNMNVSFNLTETNNTSKTFVLKPLVENFDRINDATTQVQELEIPQSITVHSLLSVGNKILQTIVKNADQTDKGVHEYFTEKYVKMIEENEIENNEKKIPEYYDVLDDNSTDYPIIDYIELYKDTTNEDVDFYVKPSPLEQYEVKKQNVFEKNEDNKVSVSGDVKDSSGIRTKMESGGNYIYNQTDMTPEAVFPWIATIFVKNNENQSQFDYYCDGAILNNRTILTAARCLVINNETVNADNLIVILGKTSLQMSGEDEQIHSVKQIKLHDNFTNGNGPVENDIAIIYLEVAIEFSDKISPAYINGSDASGELKNAITTGWHVSGELVAIYFGDNKSCTDNQTNNTFCATYGNYVTTCPSFGGLYAERHTHWLLRGLLLGDPSSRDVCLTKTVVYTDLQYYFKWINDNMY